MNEQTATDTMQIHNLLCHFMQAFDDKNWTQMRACLCDTVFCDYSSFRREAPAEMTAETYVAKRREALSDLDMQHNFLNLRVEVHGHTASARCNYLIHRFRPDFAGEADGFFHSYGHYDYRLVRVDGAWKISHIAQHLLKNHGNPDIHGAIRPATEQGGFSGGLMA